MFGRLILARGAAQDVCSKVDYSPRIDAHHVRGASPSGRATVTGARKLTTYILHLEHFLGPRQRRTELVFVFVDTIGPYID